jgi:hypothetical protein
MLLLAISLGLRLLNLSDSLWLDEAGSLSQASASDFWTAARSDVHPPLYFLLLRLGLKFTHSFTLLRLFSVLCGVALIALVLVFFRRKPVAATVLGVVVAGLPELVRHSQELRPYSLLFLLLGGSLLLSIGAATGESSLGRSLCLGLILVLAAATYIGTAFFVLGLIPLLLYPASGSGRTAILTTILALAPAGLLLLLLEFGFLQRPAQLPDGWWVPPATMDQLTSSLAEASGWNGFGQFADAVSRHLPGSGRAIRIAGAAGLVFAAWVAWGRRNGERISWLLAISGIVYIGSLVVYSRIFTPIVIGRTILPGLLPLAAGMALGIGGNRHRIPVLGATIAIAAFVLFANEPGIRRALYPHDDGLRGLARVMRSRYRPGDQLVLFKSMDYGLVPYWPDISATSPLQVDQAQPISAIVVSLHSRISSLQDSGRVLIALRADYYTAAHPLEVSAVLNELKMDGLEPQEAWRDADLIFLEAEKKGR